MNILITGGTGLVGKELTSQLLNNGHSVSILSRSKKDIPNVTVYTWDLKKGKIEDGALQNVDVLVHLAGAGIADERWTNERKKIIINSRVEPVKLLMNKFKEIGKSPKTFVSASAIGFYGGDRGEERLTEDSIVGGDFLAKCTYEWEEIADTFGKEMNCRVAKIRIGVVLSENGGALPKLIQPIKFGAGTALGSGKQWMSWIHNHDLAAIFVKAIEDETMTGAYNATAPHPVSNEEMTKVAAKVLNRPLILPNAPEFALKLVFGEMAVVILGGTYVENKRIVETTNFTYQFPEIKGALRDLIG
jgi:hypothetical protein